jgi:hypothetical protein
LERKSAVTTSAMTGIKNCFDSSPETIAEDVRATATQRLTKLCLSN